MDIKNLSESICSFVNMAHGGNNVYEAISPIINDGKYHPGLTRKIYRGLASLLGYDDKSGDLFYSLGDVSLSGFAALRMPVLIENPTRLASRGFLDKPRTTNYFVI